MAQNIILKRSAVPGRVPDTGSINFGEVAINTYDGKLYFKKSGSVESVETIVTTNSITSGSIHVSDDITIQRDLYVIRDVITNGDIDAGGSLSGSGLSINDTLNINHNNFQLTGSAAITGSLTVLGTINATQFNINVISSSIIFASGSTKFGDSEDDIMSVTGSIEVTGAVTASAFVGDGSRITNLNLDSELPKNGYDYNIDDVAPISDFNTGSTKYIIDFRNEVLVGTPVGQITYIANSTGNAQIVPGSDKIYLISGDVEAGYITSEGFDGNIVGIGNPTNFSSSVNNRIKNISTNLFATTGSNTFKGNETITGSLFVSGTTELGGNLVPKTARGATLGTLERPFSEIFVSSGSINIASDIPGDPNTTLKNIGGNILVSAGGMRLVGNASFIATTGSFEYLSGSFTHIGSQFNIGDTITTGSLAVSGSTIMIGNNTMTGNTSLTGSVTISGSTVQIGDNTLEGNTILSGSVGIENIGDMLVFSSSLDTRIKSTSNEALNNTTASLKEAISVSGSNVTIIGNLYVSGATTTINATQIDLSGSTLKLDAGAPVNAGIQVHDKLHANTTASFIYDTTNTVWKIGPYGSEVEIATINYVTASIQTLSSSVFKTDSTQSYQIIANAATASNSSASLATSISASNYNITNNSSSLATSISASNYNITANSASTWGVFQSASAYSASFYTTINSATQSIGIISASALGAFQSASVYSGSLATSISASNYNITANSASVNSLSSSFNNRIGTIEGKTLISGSSQVLNGSGIWSSSAQMPIGVVSSSSQILNGSGIYSSSAQLPTGLISSSAQLTSSLDGRYAITGSNTFIGNEIISGSLLISGSTQHNGNVTITGSIVMDATIQTNILKTSITNPSAYVIHTFPTASHGGASYMVSAIEVSTGKSTTYNLLVAQGNNKIDKITSYLIKSEGSSPTPTIATVINVGNVELRVTDNGTFTYRGIVQLF